MKQRKRRKNIVAKDLRSPKYRQRVERQKKGKGSFDRNVERAKKYMEDTREEFLENVKRAKEYLND